jgi:CRP-like cAMP-binding protein
MYSEVLMVRQVTKIAVLSTRRYIVVKGGDVDTKTQDSLENFFLTGRSSRYSKGDIILRGDEMIEDVCYVGKGHVKIYSINDLGEEYIHIIYKRGDIFPLIQIFSAQPSRRIFYESLDSSVIWKISKEKFLNRLHKSGDKLTFNLFRQFAYQFNIFADRLDNLEYKTAYERVIYRLLFLAGRFGKETEQGLIIDAPITHKIIANSINLTRESVSRELEKLHSDNLITTEKGRIIIKNVQKLSQQFSEPVSTNLWGLK